MSGSDNDRGHARAPGRARRLLAALAAAALLAPAAPAGAVRIAYAAHDLPDTGAGDLWQLDYFVSDASFAAGFGFAIVFPLGDAEALEALPAGAGAEWDVIVLQPDPALPADGLFDAQALVDGATLALPFSVRFHWTGNGTPGAQDFLVYDPDFVTIETGVTAPVPEPAAATLLALGLAGLGRRRRRRAR